jgi:hypothetical protein
MNRVFLLRLLVLLSVACWIGLLLVAWPTKDATPPLFARMERRLMDHIASDALAKTPELFFAVMALVGLVLLAAGCWRQR